MHLSYFIMALIAGAAFASQTAINSRLAHAMLGQPLVSAMISFAIGTLSLFLLCLWKADLSHAFAQLPQQPLWKLMGGILGAGFVFTTIFLASKIGMSHTLFFAIIGQLCAAAIIDHFGLFGMNIRPFSAHQFIGLAIILLGLAVYFWGGKWFGLK